MEQHPLETLSLQFLKSRDFAKTTVKSYQISYKYYIAYLKEQDILYAKTSDVLDFRETLRSKGHSSYYIHIHISALKGLYRYLKVNQYKLKLAVEYRYDIMALVKNEVMKPHVNKPLLTLKEAKQMLLTLKKNRKTIYDYRNYAIVCLMITAGLRPDEIIHLKKEDYQVHEETKVLEVKKRRSTRIDTVYLSSETICALDAYLYKRQKKDNPYLFISQNQTTKEGHLSRTFFYYVFKKILKASGLERTDITPHCLRHTAAHLNLLRGDSLDATRRLLRHVNIESTLIYQNYIDKMRDDSEEAIDAFILKEEAFSYNDLHFFKPYLY